MRSARTCARDDRDGSRQRGSVVTLILAERIPSNMNRSQLIALVFAILMMTSMVAGSAIAMF